MKGASKGLSGKVKKASETKKKPVYKKGETPYDKRREEYGKQLDKRRKNQGLIPYTKEERDRDIDKKYPPSKRVK